MPEDHRIGIHYLPGMVISIKRAWGEQLIAEGYAVETKRPPNVD
ncbi:MAG TPA: hypothetical protein VGG68_00680 [Caulobacteraceae bacterium]